MSVARRARVGVLLSGRGSNFEALHDAMEHGEIPAEVVLVLSNVEDAPGLEKARRRGLATTVVPHRGVTRKEHDAALVAALREAEPDWVCLAGYMRILGASFVDAFPRRILNIHPSLLPAFPGLDAQGQAWAYGVRVSGCTVHLVDRGMDTGPIVAQETVDVGDSSGPEDLAAKILAVEHRLYPRALGRLLQENWRLEGRRVVFGEKIGAGG